MIIHVTLEFSSWRVRMMCLNTSGLGFVVEQ
jgi:hypothetical protein